MDHRILKVLCLVALFLLPASSIESQTVLGPLLRDPSRAEWSSLSPFSQTVTRGGFDPLREVFDPFHGLGPFLQITDSGEGGGGGEGGRGGGGGEWRVGCLR